MPHPAFVWVRPPALPLPSWERGGGGGRGGGLRGRGGGGGGGGVAAARIIPSPCPSPTRGEGTCCLLRRELLANHPQKCLKNQKLSIPQPKPTALQKCKGFKRGRPPPKPQKGRAYT